jgi:uncharacterized damage-inducible protein DinB
MPAGDEPLTGDELQRRLREGRAGLDEALALFPVERWEEPLLADGWSVKDTLAHLTHWQNEVIDRLGWPAERRRPPLDAAAIDRINAEVYAAQREAPLRDVRRQFEQACDSFSAAFAALDDAALNDRLRWTWTGGAPVWHWAAGDGWEHYAEHADNIRAAAARV